MSVKGIFTSDAGIVGERKGDFTGGLLRVHPTGTAPLLALSAGMPSREANDTIINWFEENHNAGRTTITNNATTGTSLIVSDVSFITAGMILMIETTGEHVFVESISGSTLTVSRGFAGTTNTTINGSSTPVGLQRLSTAHEEASSRPVAVANLGYPRYNYTQIFRNSWDVSRTARRVDFYTGDKVAKNKKDCALFHAEDIERAAMWGKKVIGVKNSHPFRTMDGILAQISTNVTAQSTDIDWTKLDSFLMDVFERNIQGKPNERIAFCGNVALSTINKLALAMSTMQITPGITEMGMKVMKWITPYGDISLMTHPLMVQSAVWTKDLYVLHPGAISFRWLDRTHEDNYDKDGARAGVDADFGVITSELSVEYGAERTGGIYTGIDTADTSAPIG